MAELPGALLRPWALSENRFERIIETARTALSGDGKLPDLKALAARDGRDLEDGRQVQVRDGIAVVPVVGPIVHRPGVLSRLLGATSVQDIAHNVRAAAESRSVEGILFEVDSPGGQVAGVSELSDLLFNLRSEIPVRAHVSGSGTSGAYWIASAARRVDAADTALVGSIGVRTAFKLRSRPGVEKIEIVSSQTPRKHPDPTAEDGREQIQQVVDDLADVFVDDVSRNRGVPRATVLEDFGQGGTLVGERAVEAGLVDEVSTFEEALADFSEDPEASGWRPVRAGPSPEERREASVERRVEALVAASRRIDE